VLVNNVEAFDPRKGKVWKASDRELIDTVNANTFPVVFMCRFLGPDMKEREAKSAIINMTSYYSSRPRYNLPIFSAGKGMQDTFSQILGYENQDMDILTVKGLPVKSHRNPRGVEAEDLVEGVFKDLGHEKISYGHWKHSLYRYMYLV